MVGRRAKQETVREENSKVALARVVSSPDLFAMQPSPPNSPSTKFEALKTQIQSVEEQLKKTPEGPEKDSLKKTLVELDKEFLLQFHGGFDQQG